MKVFKKAIENVKPAVEVKSRRVGGSTYQVPVEVRPARKLALSMRWLIAAAQARGEKTMRARLAGELPTPPRTAAPRSRRRKTPTAWPRPTRPSPITGGNGN